jgi:hypothetical protein
MDYDTVYILHFGRVYIHEVLHGVLYPEAHDHGLKKKYSLHIGIAISLSPPGPWPKVIVA